MWGAPLCVWGNRREEYLTVLNVYGMRKPSDPISRLGQRVNPILVMEQTNTPEQIAVETGQQKAESPATTEPQIVAQDSKDVESALILAEDYRKELEKAQKKIRHLEKGTESEEESSDLSTKVDALREEIVALREQQAGRITQDSENLAKLRTREAELRAALLARQAASNSSLGANQDKSRPETPLPKMNPQQERLYARIAQRTGTTAEEEWRKANSKK